MTPSVITLQLHLDGCQMCRFKKDTDLQSVAEHELNIKTMLTQFFWMNANDPVAKAQKYLYKEFPQWFVWNNQSRTWKQR